MVEDEFGAVVKPFGRQDTLTIQRGGKDARPTIEQRLARRKDFDSTASSADEEFRTVFVPSEGENDIYVSVMTVE